VDSSKFKCLPTCDVTDGRFLALSGQGLQTLSPPDLYLEISVPAGSTSFDVGIFDAQNKATTVFSGPQMTEKGGSRVTQM